MNGLNSREEDTDKKLVDVFVESCDIEDGHSSSEDDSSMGGSR